MDRVKLFEVLDLLDLPKDSSVVVGPSVLLTLPEAWRTRTSELELVVSAEGQRELERRGWNQSAESPQYVREVAGVTVKAATSHTLWSFDRLFRESLEIAGHGFADPGWVMEELAFGNREEHDNFAADIAAWRAWNAADPGRLKRFRWTHPSTPFKERITYNLGVMANLITLTSGWWEAPGQRDALHLVAQSPYGIMRLRELGATDDLINYLKEGKLTPGAPVWGDFVRKNTTVKDDDVFSTMPPNLIETISVAEWNPATAPVIAAHERHFERSIKNLRRKVQRSVEAFGPPPYHDLAHFEAVYRRLLELLEAADPRLPRGVEQALLLAALVHDFGHQGSTLRRDAPGGLISPELGVDITTEMVTAIHVDKSEELLDMPFGVRVLVAQLIDATTMGVEGKGPQTRFERMLVSADICPEDDFDDWYKASLDVTYGEVPAREPPRTFAGWIDNRLRFLDRIVSTFCEEAIACGWDEIVEGHRNILLKVKDRSLPDKKLEQLERDWAAAEARSHTLKNPGSALPDATNPDRVTASPNAPHQMPINKSRGPQPRR